MKSTRPCHDTTPLRLLTPQLFPFAKPSLVCSLAFALLILVLPVLLTRGADPERPADPKETNAPATPPSGGELKFDRAKATDLAEVEFRKTSKRYSQAFNELLGVLDEVRKTETFASQLAFNAQQVNLEKAVSQLGATERFFENPGAEYCRILGTNHWDAATLERVGKQVNENYAAIAEAVPLFAQLRVQCRAVQRLVELARSRPGGWTISADHRWVEFIDRETQRAYRKLDDELNDGFKALQEAIDRWDAVAWKGGSSTTNAAPKPRKRLLH